MIIPFKASSASAYVARIVFTHVQPADRAGRCDITASPFTRLRACLAPCRPAHECPLCIHCCANGRAETIKAEQHKGTFKSVCECARDLPEGSGRATGQYWTMPHQHQGSIRQPRPTKVHMHPSTTVANARKIRLCHTGFTRSTGWSLQACMRATGKLVMICDKSSDLSQA